MQIYLNCIILLLILSINLNCFAESHVKMHRQINDNTAKLLVTNWKKDVTRLELLAIPTSNFTEYLSELESCNQMIDHGITTIPYILELGEDAFRQSEYALIGQLSVRVLEILTKKRFKQYPYNVNKINFQRYLTWWENGYEEDIQRFNILYEKYIRTEVPSIIEEIKDIGIRILPEVIAKIENGDEFLIPVVEHLEDLTWSHVENQKNLVISQRSDLTQKEKVSLVKEWWTKNKTRYSMDYEK
jgi:hypothetical protein